MIYSTTDSIPGQEIEEIVGVVVIPPFLTSVKTREFLGYSSCRGGTPPIAECGRILL